jgi:hypothetical protein
VDDWVSGLRVVWGEVMVIQDVVVDRSHSDGDSYDTAATPADIVNDLGGVASPLGCTASGPVTARLYANEWFHDWLSVGLCLRMGMCADLRLLESTNVVLGECVTTALSESVVMVLHRLALSTIRDELGEGCTEGVAGV